MPTNVPQPIFTAQGYVSPQVADVLAGALADINAAFGGNLNMALTTPQGQLASSEAAAISNVYDTFALMTQMFDPAYNFGRYQDAIARIYFLSRIPSQPTTIQVNCVGGVGTIIPAYSLVEDESTGNLYLSTTDVTIPALGNINVQFEAQVPGPQALPAAVNIYRSVPGWDTVTFVSGVVGQNVESTSDFEQRRSLSVAQNSLGSLPSVLGSVLSVPGVIDAYVTENVNNSPQPVGGVTLLPNSLYVAAVGGDSTAIATAIWKKKAPGCAYNGNTSVTVYDTSAVYEPPYPAYQVVFEIPINLVVVFSVTLLNNLQVPANVATLVQNAIIGAFAGLDGGIPAKIGTEIFASRFYATIAALGSWVRIIDILIGTADTASSVFTGSISGTTLTVGSTTSGALAVGQILVDNTGNIVPGTTIVSGSGTTWQVSISQTLASEQLYGVVANQFTSSVNINQYPVTSAGFITVNLQ